MRSQDRALHWSASRGKNATFGAFSHDFEQKLYFQRNIYLTQLQNSAAEPNEPASSL